MNVEMQRLAAKIPAMNEFEGRLMNGLLKVCTNQITQEVFEDGISKMFAPRMAELWRFWMAGKLFRCQEGWQLEAFLMIDGKDDWHDRNQWDEFESVAGLTKQQKDPEYHAVLAFAKKWIIPGLKWRQQFLDKDGHLPQTQPDSLRDEWQKLMKVFSIR